MESNFQFSNPSLSDLVFSVNKEFSALNGQRINLKVHMEVEVNREENVPGEAQVALKVELGEKRDNMPFYLVAVERADFKWSQELKDETVKDLLNQNAPALLLSYLRPIIVQITANGPFGAYHIPFMNFVGKRNN